MYDQGWIDAIVVFAYKGTYENWIDEFNKHTPEHIVKYIALWSSSMNSKERRILDSVMTPTPLSLKILVMNVEALAHERSFKIAYSFAVGHRTLGIMDESTAIKNPASKRTKAAWKIRDVCVAKRIMTGSAVDNRPLDSWAQFEFLRPGALGFSSYYAFRAYYADLVPLRVRDNAKGSRLVKIVSGYKNLSRLRSSMLNLSSIIKKSDCLDLPPKVYQTRYVELTEDQKDAYEKMRKLAIIELEDTLVTAKLMLTKILRLHQIVCGFIRDDEGKDHSLKSNRISAMMDLLEESNGRGLIWANYQRSIREIETSLIGGYGADSVRTFYGETERVQRLEVKSAALRGTETPVRWLVASQQAGGYGNTWTAFNFIIYFANSFDGELRNQSEDRAHRVGQTSSVTYVDIVAKGTVDERILSTLRNKKSLANEITASNWKDWLSKP
jgi:SNF2 family DNA or RNA helicase